MADALRTDSYSSWVGLIYVYNLIVGTGALTLPSAFAKAGWGLSVALLIVLAFVGFVTVTFIIESMACANAVLRLKQIQKSSMSGESEVTNSSVSEDGLERATLPNQSRYYSLNQCVQLGEMTQLFFNKTGRFLFYLALCVYLYGDLAIYGTAVATTLTNLVCSERKDDDYEHACWESSAATDLTRMSMYRLLLTAFVLVVGPFSYFNVQKTKYLQIATSTMRWCAFLIMIGLALDKIAEHGPQGAPPVVQIRNVPALIGACVYSFMCHHSLPGLVTPFADKSHVTRLLGLDYVLICLFYLLLALTGSFAFDHLEDLYTLNFIRKGADGDVGWFMTVVDYFLALFPVFTLSTSFPIIAITLQSNLKALFLDASSARRHGFFVRCLLFPTLAVVPPAVVSLSTHNLKDLVAFTGTYAGSAIQYLIPAFLVWCARKVCRSDLAQHPNQYRSPFQGPVWIVFVVVWCLACVILSTVNLIQF